MQAINDVLARQIIHASIAGGPTAASRYLHPTAGSIDGTPLLALRRLSPMTAVRRAASRMAARFAAPEPTPPVCCAA